MTKKFFRWGILIGLILIVSYFNRWIFVFKFEPEYWENYYYTSQWNIPNSQRVISDGGVYRYIGYRLVNGENPFNVDYWVPPMGKYWYGVGAKYLQNPYLISFSFYLLSILIFSLLTKLIFKKNNTQWLAIYLWTLNPLIIEQIGQTMLDLPLVLFFLTHVYFLFQFKENKSIIMLILAGIFLGLMAGTKPAYFVPMIGLIDWWWILIIEKNHKIKKLFLYLCFVIVGYLLAYTCYFIAHPNPIPWIRLHEKVINFQKGNGGSHDVMNIFKTIFLDKYQGFWVGGKEMFVTGWSIILPLGTILLARNILFFKKIFKENSQIIYLTLISIGYILMCLTIDFWPRYLVLLIPILILIVVDFFKNKKLILILLLIAYIPWLKFNFFPDPNTMVNEWNQEITDQHYRETYRLIDKNSRQKINEDTWLKYWKNNKEDNLPKELILENNQWRFKTSL
jgi:hypothetical protein